MNSGKKIAASYWVSLLSFLGNIILFVLKFWAATVSYSIALMADAWHTVSDSISTIIVVIGIKISEKPADREHPYGHQRAETIAALFIGFFLMLVAFEFGRDAIKRLIERRSVTYEPVAIWVTVASVIVKEIMARVSIKVGIRNASAALVADGWHHRSDAISSIIILVGIFINPYIWWMDSFLACLLSVYITYIAIKIVSKAVQPLMGGNVEPEVKEKIMNICREVEKEELYPHHFHKHEYGKHTEMTFHIILPEKKSLKEANGITRKLFRSIKNEMGIIATIHIDVDSKYSNTKRG